MKSIFVKSLISILFIIVYSTQEKVYRMDTMIYYDPITGGSCSKDNYWTPFDKYTTCYRFAVLTKDDNENRTSIKLMLDHNIAADEFSNIPHLLHIVKEEWVHYDGEIEIIDQQTLFSLMRYSQSPNLQKKSVSPTDPIGHYCGGSRYIIDGEETDNNGFWTSTSYAENDSYAYGMGNLGENVIALKTDGKGIRPVITLKKNLIKNYLKEVDISDLVNNKSKLYMYKFEDKKYEDVVFKQMQGGVTTDDKFFFMSSNGKLPNNSVMYVYGGENYDTKLLSRYGPTGHGNAITYNTKTKKILLPVVDGRRVIEEYDAENFELVHTYNVSDGYPYLTGISYDEDNDYYVCKTNMKAMFADAKDKWKIKYQFDFIRFEGIQDVEYHDGLAFYVTSDLGISAYQSYTFHKKLSGIIYVYHARLIDGKPEKNFGRIITKIYIEPKGELEDISIRNGKIYLYYAAIQLDKVYAYKIFELDYKEVYERIINCDNDDKRIKFLEE